MLTQARQMERKAKEATASTLATANDRERDIQHQRVDHEEDARATLAG